MLKSVSSTPPCTSYNPLYMNVSVPLAFLTQASDDCKFLAFDWASPFVQDEVTTRLMARDLDGMEAFVRDYKGVEFAATLRGGQFQRLVGAWISAGGELPSRSLDDLAEKPLRLPRQKLVDVRELPDKLQPEHYYRFEKPSERAVDAISVLRYVGQPVGWCSGRLVLQLDLCLLLCIYSQLGAETKPVFRAAAVAWIRVKVVKDGVGVAS